LTERLNNPEFDKTQLESFDAVIELIKEEYIDEQDPSIMTPELRQKILNLLNESEVYMKVDIKRDKKASAEQQKALYNALDNF
jgi:hypothetical protein